MWAGLNFVTRRVLRRGGADNRWAGAHLLVDVAALTIMFGLSGGATNSFTTLYFVPITLATQVSPRWTWTLASTSLVGFGLLFVFDGGALEHAAHGHHSFGGHLQGMWVSFGLTGVLVTFFVHRIAINLSRQRGELVRLREQRMQDRHLAALGTLAAGAAHELSTPLGSVRILATELPHMDAGERGKAIATIRKEIDRCKTIVHGMATPELRATAFGPEAGTAWPLDGLLEATDGLPADVPVRFEFQETSGPDSINQPRQIVLRQVRELISNAMEACRSRAGARGVDVRVVASRERVELEIHDDGVGMDTEAVASAFEPFYTTRPEGEGMGLGLYLARAQLHQLGGDIEVASAPGSGTVVRLWLPRVGKDAAP